jgi:hypothetical protein
MLPSSSLVGLSAFEVGGDAVASSQRFHLKGSRLSVSRLATVFFRGDWVDGAQRPEFVLCYDGTHDAGMTVCDRIPSNAVAPLDAGPADASWGGRRSRTPTRARPSTRTPSSTRAPTTKTW